MSTLFELLDAAAGTGKLLPVSRTHIDLLINGSSGTVARDAVEELAQAGEWGELNDRFFKTLAFGTGGLRGRTIGRKVTRVEQGAGGPNGRPEHPCVGTATMNYFNLSRAVRGLIAYARAQAPSDRRPRLVFSHDTRHFSRDFAEFCARVSSDHGCDAWLFDGPRSTPELSFAIRELRADAGVMLTASHNPSHDNGFKAYFNDGAQFVEPHATAVIGLVNALVSETYEAVPKEQRGEINRLGTEFDEIYMGRLGTLLLQPEKLTNTSARVVFTNLHGTGGHIIVPMLKRLGFTVQTVEAQDTLDGRFPTVESPNPENASALDMAIKLADREGYDLVIGTDPDADRMGIVARDGAGQMRLLTGNQIGSLMAWHRAKTAIEAGWLNETNKARAVLIKTFVTTELQTAIAKRFGIDLVDTLTGFKYIASKLLKYEQALPEAFQATYREVDEATTRAWRLEHSKFFLFGGEESYGYLGSDFVRDKDANGAAVMFAEVAAYAAAQGSTVADLLDTLHREFGYHEERGKSLVMEGADGAQKIEALANSYSDRPPTIVQGSEVARIRDFARQDLMDSEGDPLPKEKMLFVDLADGRSFAVRPSGTEPKIKFYLFGKAAPDPDIDSARARVGASLDALWAWIEADAKTRLAS